MRCVLLTSITKLVIRIVNLHMNVECAYHGNYSYEDKKCIMLTQDTLLVTLDHTLTISDSIFIHTQTREKKTSSRSYTLIAYYVVANKLGYKMLLILVTLTNLLFTAAADDDDDEKTRVRSHLPSCCHPLQHTKR